MNTYRRTAIIVGALFITATVTSSLYYVIVTPILDAPDYLVKVSENVMLSFQLCCFQSLKSIMKP
jgi:hypothetical protein